MPIDIFISTLPSHTYVTVPQFIEPSMAAPKAPEITNGLLGPAAVVEISPESRAAYAASVTGGVQTQGIENTAANMYVNRDVLNSGAAVGSKECQTCNSRTYVDESDDSSVSFQTATHISPGAAPAAVAAHEGEHVSNERARAGKEGRRIVSQSVSIHTSVCPECGIVYVAGGETKAVTASENKQNYDDQRGSIDLIA